MLNNDILRRVRYIKDYRDGEMIEIFLLAELEVSRDQLNRWLKKDDDPDYQYCEDIAFSKFLNGLIIRHRGKKDEGPPKPDKVLNNNIIFRKLVITFNLKSDEVLDVFKLVNFRLGKHELSAFFRKPDHKNYRECKSQILRNFLNGLQVKVRG